MANALRAGGGFKNGALAQEEALCYRSSLFFTLKIAFYPLKDKATIYSPTVLVIRDSLAKGHNFLDVRTPAALPVISVVSSAALYRPNLDSASPKDGSTSGEKVYSRKEDADMMKDKIRSILRTAIKNKHRKIVLGAFGCGAFNNPAKLVASFFKEVFAESEFCGGWFEDVVFGVLDQGTSGSHNFKVFENELGGVAV
jgi:uncharacterized protein (TIGR02452 family)